MAIAVVTKRRPEMNSVSTLLLFMASVTDLGPKRKKNKYFVNLGNTMSKNRGLYNYGMKHSHTHYPHHIQFLATQMAMAHTLM